MDWYVFLGDTVLALAIAYAIFFMYRRLGKYDPELDVLIRYSIVFLVVGEAGRITDIIDDFCCFDVFRFFQWTAYFVSIVGIIYSIVHYISIFEKRYVPTVKLDIRKKQKPEGNNSLLSGAYIIFSKYRLADILEILKTTQLPVIALTRFPDVYSSFGESSEVVWITQLPAGISPTSLHVIQGKVVEFLEERRGAVVVVDCVEYLLLYNDFKTVVKFLLALKDYIMASGNAFIVFVDDTVLSPQERSLLLKEFEPL
ncbi:DUF835 domain-containing protein [Thermococcus sp. 21S7]|uniref:DUF835 domain-containing protein n=1 Tax=Thermococcus sp. 21S7 TaxID=1638221 RepID=UPI00143ADFD3